MTLLGLGAASGALPGRVVRGEPYRIGDRTLTPLARTVSLGPADGRWRLRWVEPLAVVEAVSGETRILAVRRPTGLMLVAGLIAPVLVYLAVRALAGRPGV